MSDEELRPHVNALLDGLGKRRVHQPAEVEIMQRVVAKFEEGNQQIRQTGRPPEVQTGQFLRTDLPIPPDGARDVLINRIVEIVHTTKILPDDLISQLDPANTADMTALGCRLTMRNQGWTSAPPEGHEHFGSWYGQVEQ